MIDIRNSVSKKEWTQVIEPLVTQSLSDSIASDTLVGICEHRLTRLYE